MGRRYPSLAVYDSQKVADGVLSINPGITPKHFSFNVKYRFYLKCIHRSSCNLEYYWCSLDAETAKHAFVIFLNNYMSHA